MRPVRLSLIATAIITMALALGPTALGQSEAPLDPMGANYWTGTWTRTQGGQGATTERTGYTEYLGEVVHGVVEADDPRMEGAWTQINNVHFAPSREAGEGDVGIVSGTARIDNDTGAWVGTFTIFGGQPGGEEWYVMEGEGAYEGLTTVFRFQGEDGFEGVIMPGDLPPLPDPSVLTGAAAWRPTVSGDWESVPGGPKVAYMCFGEGTPVIVLEAGTDSGGIGSYPLEFWEPLAARTTVCTYDRLGTGASDAPTEEVRTLDDTSAVLEGLLDSLPFEPPFVLVGQSGGGNFHIDYAAKHPDQVAGLVLIEAYHDDPDALAAGFAAEGMTPGDSPERVDWVDGARRLDEVSLPIGDFPVLVITATDADPGNVENQAYWLGISPTSEQVVLEGSHNLHFDDPAGVTAQILKMIDAL